MARRSVHHMDFQTLVSINREVVSLTGEQHEYSAADGKKLEDLLAEVQSRADNLEFEQAIHEKAALLIFRIASGQYFRAGNKRTALVAGLTFLRKNGYSIDLNDAEFVSAVDKVGIAAATLDDLYGVMGGLMKKSTTERRGWDNAVKQAVESNRKVLTDLASE